METDGAVRTYFSEQYMLNCDREDHAHGCDGAQTDKVLWWMEENGLLSDHCQFYHEMVEECHPYDCDVEATEDYELFNVRTPQALVTETKDEPIPYLEITEEIYANGPVYFSMNVPFDFMRYRDGIFVTESRIFLGGHAVRCVGWGKDPDATDDTPVEEAYYWIVANSWSDEWGMDGYFHIRWDQRIAYKSGWINSAPSVRQLIE